MSRSYLICTILCLLLGAGACSRARTYPDYSASSGFTLDAAASDDPLVVENLETLCRVWGYVKYHHPVFAGDEADADYELFGLLPRVVPAAPSQRNRILSEWIDALGPYDVSPEKYDSLPENRLNDYRTDLGWTHDTLRLGGVLSQRLERLRFADRSRGNRYVCPMHYDWMSEGDERINPCFDGEKPYEKLGTPDCGYRLLAAFRFWNMVEYFFPMKYLTDKSWDEVLPEYIGRMIALHDGDYRRTMWRMIAETKDSHADMAAADEIFGSYHLPVEAHFAQDRLVVTAVDTTLWNTRNGACLSVGDEILAVDHRPAAYYKDRVRTYIPCSNDARVRDYAADVMLRSLQNTSLRVRYRRNGVVHDTIADVSIYAERQDWKHGSYQDLGGGIHYISPEGFSVTEAKPLLRPGADVRGLIVDLRKYPMSDDFDDYIASHIVPQQAYSELVTCYTYPVVSLPGTFASSKTPESEWRRPYKAGFPVAVLVDGWTQSAGESYVQWLQTCEDVVVVGNQTAGANGNVSYIDLPGGVRTRFSGLGWFYSDGVPVQRRGVRIDVEVHPTVEGLTAGRDETFEKAQEILRDRLAENEKLKMER